MSFAHKARKFTPRSQRIEPRVKQHCGMAEKAVVDGAGQHVQCLGFLTQITQLPRQIIHPLRIAERRLHQLFPPPPAFFPLAPPPPPKKPLPPPTRLFQPPSPPP